MPRKPECEPGSPEDLYRGAVGAIFRRIRTDHNWSLREFGERVGVAHTSLYAVERRDNTPGIDTLGRVAASIDLSLPAMLALVNEELIGDTASEPGSLASVIEAATGLTDQQRRELLSFVDYLRYRDAREAR